MNTSTTVAANPARAGQTPALELAVGPGDHVIALMSSRRDVDVLAPYLRHVAPTTQPGVIVAGPGQRAEAFEAVESAALDIPSAALYAHDPLIMGMNDGWFDSEQFLARTKTEVDRLIDRGATRVYHCGVMRWIIDAAVPDDECIYLEARINQQIEGSCMSGFCVYDVRYIGSHLLVQLLRTHPKVMLDDRIVENPFYERPERVIAELGRAP
ncbi:MAG: MEDS domain-containing protein [Gemmatimonadetes bacterium]|nr:MEDS domain-containing protein [Gemmatimonadota bacterium]